MNDFLAIHCLLGGDGFPSSGSVNNRVQLFASGVADDELKQESVQLSLGRG